MTLFYPQFQFYIVSIFLILLTYVALYFFYQLFWSPLSRFPGPKLWAVSRVPFAITMTQGRYAQTIRELHQKYGDIIRVAPDELSFSDPRAWHDIHQIRSSGKSFPRNPIFFSRPESQPADSIVTTSDDSQHSRMRRVLEKSFTDKSIRAQEPVVQKNVELFIQQLRLLSEKSMGNAIDMVKWYSFVTFDIFGDLGFGEPFGCLQSGRDHRWVSLGTNYVKAATIDTAVKYYPWLHWILRTALKITMPSLMQIQQYHYQHSVDKISRRMSLERKERDFMTPLLSNKENFRNLSLDEIYSNFALLIIAGGETSTTALSGITHNLVHHPLVLQTLEAEIFQNFGDDKPITMEALKDLPYLNAVIKEGLRMCNPTPAGNSRIVPDGGALVCGYYIPERVRVSVHPLTLHFSQQQFSLPNEFLPERWLESRPAKIANHNPAAMNPFGMGFRRCLGENLAWFELRIIIASVIYNFHIRSDRKSRPLCWQDQKTYLVVQKEPVLVELRSRN